MDVILKYFSDFSQKQLEQLAALQGLYTEWNSKINVVSRKDIDSLYVRHVLHSLAIAAVCTFDDGAEVVDIGTGGGFPGIPLAIFFPQVRFLLTDSIGKKIKVVQEVATAIGLENVEAVHSRVEDIGSRTFDFAVSRAVAPLAELWQWVRPKIRKGHASAEFANGLFCLKGGDLRTEISRSGLHPDLFDVESIFKEPELQGKVVLYVPLKR